MFVLGRVVTALITVTIAVFVEVIGLGGVRFANMIRTDVILIRVHVMRAASHDGMPAERDNG